MLHDHLGVLYLNEMRVGLGLHKLTFAEYGLGVSAGSIQSLGVIMSTVEPPCNSCLWVLIL